MEAALIHRPLILLVEDDVRVARRLARMLSDDGFEVELANDGAAAIARLTRTPLPDALVTDLYLPHADGLAVTRFARSRCASMPVVVVTGHPEFFARDRSGEALPAVVVFPKPVDYGVLARTLKDLMPEPAAACAATA